MRNEDMAAGEAPGGAAAGAVRRKLQFPALALIVGAAISVGSFFIIQDNVATEARLRFERQASDAKHVIAARIQSYADVMYGLRSLYSASYPVTRKEFHDYVTGLELAHRHPAFWTFNYAEYVPHETKARFVARVRKDTSLDPRGYPKFAVTPTGDRPEYYVLTYVEPMAGSESVFGLDISDNPASTNRRAVAEALTRARDSGKLTSSGQLLHSTRGQERLTSLAMRLPVFRSGLPVETVEQRRASYVGSVGAAFYVKELMRGVLDEHALEVMRFKLYEAGPEPKYVAATHSVSADQLLFDSKDTSKSAGAVTEPDSENSSFKTVLPIEVGGRIWEVHFSTPHKAVIKGFDRALPSLVLCAGLLASLLLSAILYSLAASRSRAEQMAVDLRFIATHDALTGLANRAWFHDQLQHALARAARYRRNVAVLFIDLDRFKLVNDTLGHGAGDRMLGECARRLKKCLRESDTVARLGGDEFVVTMEDYASLRDTVTVAQKILAHLATPILLEGQEFTPSASIGISIYPEDGTNVEALLKNADIAMYRAKDRGRNNLQFYSAQNNRQRGDDGRSGVPVPAASEEREVEA